MKGIVKIMRGLPGAGKSSYVQSLELSGVKPSVCSADFFHMEGDKYNFKPHNLAAAHRKCFFDFMSYLRLGEPLVVVDNTNTRPIEIAPYIKIAEYFDYEAEIVWIKTPIEVAIHRQTHNVPLGTMLNMMIFLREELPKHWTVKEIHAK